MKTRVVTLKDGSSHKLYYNESTNRWSSNKSEAQDVFHRRIMEGTDQKATVIRKYYSRNPNWYTRTKIREMVNESEKKLNLLYETILTIRGNTC